MAEIRVILADDHPMIRDGIRYTLSRVKDIAVVGEAADGLEAQQLCRSEQPDILLLDLRMPDSSAVETIAWVKAHCPQTRVVILSAFKDGKEVRAVMEADIAGYILKDEMPFEIVEAVRKVADGGTWFSQDVLVEWARAQRAAAEAPEFTPRERDVLRLLAQGTPNEHIAAGLDMAERTVRHHIQNICEKLEVTTRGEAIAWAARAAWDDE